MNKINAKYGTTEFTNGEHLVITIDGVQLDEIVAKTDMEGHMTGLVCTLLQDWMDNANEYDVTRKRFELREKEITMVPVLMCPDDCDFSCTVVIAEMKLEKNVVHIKKLGVDVTPTRSSQPETVGRVVKWFQKVGPYAFTYSDFTECINTFSKGEN